MLWDGVLLFFLWLRCYNSLFFVLLFAFWVSIISLSSFFHFALSIFLFQDTYAIQSFERGIAAKTSGAFTWEIVPARILTHGHSMMC